MRAPVAVFGIGNCSRCDDAAGPLLVESLSRWLERAGLAGEVECFEEYQLQPEHALDLVGRRLALFVDAHSGIAEAVRLEAVVPAAGVTSASTHSLSPHEALAVYRQVTGEEPPPAFALGVRAASFGLGEEPGKGTRLAMREAEALLERLLRAPEAARWRRLASRPTASPAPSDRSPS